MGDVRRVVIDERSHPDGILVEPESGATGRVKPIGEEAIGD